MAFTFGQLFNPDTPGGGGVNNGKSQNKKQGKQERRATEKANKMNDAKEEESGYSSISYNATHPNLLHKRPEITEEVIKDTPIIPFENLTLEEVSDYYKRPIDKTPSQVSEEYTPPEEYDKLIVAKEKKVANKTAIETGKLIDSLIDNKKIQKVESIEKGNLLEVTYHDTSTIYNIEDIAGDKIKYTTNSDPRPREMTMDSLKKVILGPGVYFAVVGEKEKLQLKDFDLMVEEIMEEEKGLGKGASPLEQIEYMRDLLEKYNIPLAYIEPVFSEKEQKHQAELQEQARRYYEEREEVIENIGDILRNGVDKIVIHGNTTESGDVAELEPKFAENVDLDTRGALFLFGMAKGVKYNEGSYTELSKKGQKGSDGIFFNDKEPKDQTTLYIDTSGERLDYEVSDKGTEVFIDHHQKHFSKYPTSATEMAYEVLVKNKMLEREPWMDRMVDYVTSVDNLTYANHENFNENFLEYKWPKSMYALDKSVPFEKMAQWFKEGRDPLNPKFTEEELDEMIAVKRLKNGSEKISLRQAIEEKTTKIGADVSNAKFAIKVMEKRGLRLESDGLGKVIYNKQDRQKEALEIDKSKNPINKIFNGFLVAKALGYDTYATYNEKYNRFMINTNTRDLYPAYENLRKMVPEAVLVRGVMLMQPPGISNRKDITEEKFLKILGLKDK